MPNVGIVVCSDGKREFKFLAVHWELVEAQQAVGHRIIIVRIVVAEAELSGTGF